jgi:hypothetical protein
MKYLSIGFSFFCLLLFTNCDKNEGDTIEKVNIIEENIAIRSSEIFTYGLGNIPTEGNIFIQKQASHFNQSEIGIDNAQGGLSYIYKTADGFVGNDYVEIIRKSSIGNNTFSEKDLIKISITIIEND